MHDPSTGEQIGVVREASPELVDEAVAAAVRASEEWSRTTVEERESYLEAWREKLVAEADALLEITIDELGLIPAFARMIHIGRSSNCLVGIGDMARTVLEPRRITESPAGMPPVNSLVVREPAGVLAAITAWNVPLHQLISKIADGLIMGNTVGGEAVGAQAARRLAGGRAARRARAAPRRRQRRRRWRPHRRAAAGERP